MEKNSGPTCITGCSAKVAPPKFLSTRSHVNWPKISLSARGYTGILYLEKFRGGDFSGTPCRSVYCLKYHHMRANPHLCGYCGHISKV